jgi:hypothetical protein
MADNDLLSFIARGELDPFTAERLRDAYASALYEEGERIMAESKEHFVPVAHGTLRATGFVSPPQFENGEITVVLSYGGPAMPYAMAIHEHLSEHSPYSWRVAEQKGSGVHFKIGGPKYLERPVLEAAPGFTDRVAADAVAKL